MKRLFVIPFLLVSLFSFGQDMFSDYVGFKRDSVKLDSFKIRELSRVLVIGIRADSKTPVSQQIVKGSDIQETYQGEEIPILLDKTTSITSTSDGGQPQGYTYFRIRGIDQTRVNMTLNGVPLNEPEDQGVYTSNYPGFINSIQSFQVQRGVGTSTNGVASFGGSINFQGLSGLEKQSDLSLGYGSFNTARINIAQGTGLTPKNFALFADFSASTNSGYKYNSGCAGYSGFLSAGHYGDKNIIKITSFSGYSTNHMAWLAVADSDIVKNPRTNYNQNDAPDQFKQTLVQVQDILLLGQYSKWSTTAFYNRLDGSYDYFESGKRSVTLGSNFEGIISNFQFIKNKFRFNVGVNANTYDRTHVNNEDHTADLGIATYHNKGTKREFSTFGKLSYDLWKFTLFGDAQYRYTDFSYEGDVKMNPLSWSLFNPKVGLIYNQTKYFNFYFSIGKTAREPTRTDLFGGYDNLVTLTNIRPEQVVDYELGVNFIRSMVNIQANVYYMDFKDEITLLGALGSNGYQLMTSVSKSFRSGLELDLTYTPINHFSGSTNFNYSHNQITSASGHFSPLYTPIFVLNQVVGYNIGKFTIDLNGKYQAQQYISFDKYTSPEFYSLNSDVTYSYRRLTLVVQLNNITSATAYPGGYVIGTQRYFFATPGFNLYTTLKIKL